MEHRKLGRTGLEVGVIGLGTEHLERRRETMDRVLGMVVEAGANYVDLLYVDPTDADASFWDNFGPALRARREKLVLAAHWGGGARFDLPYSQRCFEDLLACLGNGYAEVGLLTMVDDEKKWEGWALESIERLRRYQDEGRIGHIGMSGHEASVALKAVRSGLIDLLMFPVNLIGHGDEGLQALLEACGEQSVGLVAMKVYHGGTLLSVNGRPSGITPEQCLSYVLSLPVSTTVPGPRNAGEMQATLHYLEATAAEKDHSAVAPNVRTLLAGQCVYCGHCLPCPEGIDVGWLIWLVDQAQGRPVEELAGEYARYRVKASACTACGVCAERCPFGVDVVAKMRRAAELFGV